ncbi:MAG TPA: hypothetical protein VMW29_00190 [Candidatus Bathyarchaeia archaeon]|nr:hypothetical protein [Candidatus Bathyarchaeia archaeon]
MLLKKVKSKIASLSRKQKTIVGLVILLIFSALLVLGFLILRKIVLQKKQTIPSGNLTKTFTKQDLGEGLSLEKTISVEKAAEQDKYQPTLKLNLSKPQGQPLNPHTKILLKIPKQFAQSSDQLSFVIPPTRVLEKDPLIVWDFGDLLDPTYIPDQICVSYILPYYDRQDFCHDVDIDEYEQFEKGEGEKIYYKLLEETQKELVKVVGPDINLDKWEAEISSSTKEEREQWAKEEEAKKLRQKEESEEIAYNRYYEEIYEQRDRAIREVLENFYGGLADTIWQWLTGAQEVLEIAVKREPMDYQSAQKVYTETEIQLSGQTPPQESPEQKEIKEEKIALEQASISGDNKVYLGDKLVLDVAEAPGGCSSIGKILYAPTNAYFLVIVWCFEGDNEIYLFKADGSDKKRITAKWDVVNYYEVEWQADGQSFTYHRINSCCVEPERVGEEGPPEGMVKYDIATGQKTLISTDASSLSIPTASPQLGSGKISTVAEFGNLPDGGCGEFESEETARPIMMELEITESTGLAFLYHDFYMGKDTTGTIEIAVQHFDLSAPDFWRVPATKLTVGKTYILKGCKPYIGTGGPGPGPLVFGVREEWPEAIREK